METAPSVLARVQAEPLLVHLEYTNGRSGGVESNLECDPNAT
jgi:hypothetical protein